MNGRISRLARCYGFCGAGGDGGYQATGEGPRQREAGQEQVPVYVRGMKWEGDREEEQTQREEGQRERSRREGRETQSTAKEKRLRRDCMPSGWSCKKRLLLKSSANCGVP